MEDPQTVPSSPIAPPPATTQAGLADNVAGTLAYVTILPAILFLILEPYNKRPFVRFHSFQCICMAVVAFALSVIAIVPLLGWLIAVAGDLTLLVFWIMCMVKAYQGELWKVPILGNYAENLAK